MSYFEREEWPGFLAAIKSAPDDDLPRLVAADWLEENGEPERAEFVRVGCELERLKRPVKTVEVTNGTLQTFDVADDYPRVYGRAVAIANVIYGNMLGPVIMAGVDLAKGIYGNLAGGTWAVERGFLSRVRAPLDVLVGGEACGRCRLWMENHDCPDCHGTCRTPGVLRELLRREPLGADGIEVSDWGPAQNPDGSYSWWRLRRPGVVDREYLLRHPRCGPFLTAPTESTARVALSRAVYAMCSPKSEVSV